jgi:mannose-6-phosphate isomerase class I
MSEMEIKQSQISSLLESLSYQIHPDNEMAFDDLNGEIGKMEDKMSQEVTHGQGYPRAS